MNEYDDPYWMLAWYIVSHCSQAEVAQSLSNDEWILRQIRHELHVQDFRGPFLDTIMEHLDAHNRIWLRGQLNNLADALFLHLDIDKLRGYISGISGISV